MNINQNVGTLKSKFNVRLVDEKNIYIAFFIGNFFAS